MGIAARQSRSGVVMGRVSTMKGSLDGTQNILVAIYLAGIDRGLPPAFAVGDHRYHSDSSLELMGGVSV